MSMRERIWVRESDWTFSPIKDFDAGWIDEYICIDLVAGLEQVITDQGAVIGRLRKALFEAVTLANINGELIRNEGDEQGECTHSVYCDTCSTPFMPTLFAYLQEIGLVSNIDNRPPDRVVQNVVQDAEEGGETDV